MNIDIDTTYKVILVLLGIALITMLSMAIKSLRAARTLQFYRKRQDLLSYAWRLFFFSVFLGGIGYAFFRFAEPVAYRYFPPSATITRTPTITTTPTITLTLQNSLTPTITPTLVWTYTPALPTEVMATIQTPIGVENDSTFSPVQFSTQTGDGWIINTTDTFTLPITQLYAGYTYDGMMAGLRWTAVWLHEDEIVCFETKVWENLTGGYYYSDYCNQKITPDMWKPGRWEVQIFVGQTWKTSGKFTILGNEPTIDPSASVSDLGETATPTLTPNP